MAIIVVFPSLSYLNSISGNWCELGWVLEEFSTSLFWGTLGFGVKTKDRNRFFVIKHKCEQTLTSITLNWSNTVSIFASCCGCTHTSHLCNGSASRTEAVWPDLPGSYWFASILDNDDALLPVQLQKQQNASQQHFNRLCEVIRNPPTPNRQSALLNTRKWSNSNPL